MTKKELAAVIAEAQLTRRWPGSCGRRFETIRMSWLMAESFRCLVW